VKYATIDPLYLVGGKPTPYQELAAAVIRQAVADLVDEPPPNARQARAKEVLQDKVSASEFFVNNKPGSSLHFWCEVAGLDPDAVVHELSDRMPDILEARDARSEKSRKAHVTRLRNEEERDAV